MLGIYYDFKYSVINHLKHCVFVETNVSIKLTQEKAHPRKGPNAIKA
jgi:hypothetical protein